jgi:hypothetical protein
MFTIVRYGLWPNASRHHIRVCVWLVAQFAFFSRSDSGVLLTAINDQLSDSQVSDTTLSINQSVKNVVRIQAESSSRVSSSLDDPDNCFNKIQLHWKMLWNHPDSDLSWFLEDDSVSLSKNSGIITEWLLILLVQLDNPTLPGVKWTGHSSDTDYSMHSTFLTSSPGSVLFSRTNLLKRKDLSFSCLTIGLIRHRRNLRSSHLSSQVCHDSHRVTLEPARPHRGVRLMVSSLSASLFHRFSSVPDLSLIFLESLKYSYWDIIINSNIELLISILSKFFRCSNESNEKAIRDRSSKVETPFLKWLTRFCHVNTRARPSAPRCVSSDVDSLYISCHRFSSVPDPSLIYLELVRYSRNWSVSNLEGSEPQIWENLYI